MYPLHTGPQLSRHAFVTLGVCALAALPLPAPRQSGRFVQDVAWSPDGMQLLFSKGDMSGSMHLFLIQRDGSSLKQITNGSNGSLRRMVARRSPHRF